MADLYSFFGRKIKFVAEHGIHKPVSRGYHIILPVHHLQNLRHILFHFPALPLPGQIADKLVGMPDVVTQLLKFFNLIIGLFQVVLIIHHSLPEHFVIRSQLIFLVQLLQQIKGNAVHHHQAQQGKDEQIGLPFPVDIPVADEVDDSKGGRRHEQVGQHHSLFQQFHLDPVFPLRPENPAEHDHQKASLQDHNRYMMPSMPVI